MNNLPLISCILPTTLSRKDFLPSAFRCFWEQTYQNTELVIVSEDDISDLIPDHPSFRFVKCDPGMSLGEKRNLAVEEAKGEVIAHMDDDDWSSPYRIEECVQVFNNNQVLVTGYNIIRFYELSTDISRKFSFIKNGIHGSSLLYMKSFWKGNQFPSQIFLYASLKR